MSHLDVDIFEFLILTSSLILSLKN